MAVSEDSAQKLFNQYPQIIQRFMKGLAEALNKLMEKWEKDREYRPYRALARAIDNGNCSYFKADDDFKGKLHARLKEDGIPHINFNGYFVVKNKDLDKVTNTYREILVGELNYFQEVNKSELLNAIAKSDRFENKDVMTFEYLNLYEFESLKAKCNDICKGFMIGTDKMNDSQYSLSVHSSSIYNKNPQKNDLCKAFLASTLSIYGPNRGIKEKQIEADVELEQKVRELKNVDSSFYIVSENDSSRFIEVAETGFEVYDSLIEEGKRVDHMIFRIDKDDVNYAAELQKYMDTMYDKVIVSNIEDLGKHLSESDACLTTLRPKKGMDAILVSKANKELTNEINRMIKEKHKGHSIEFTEYEEEAASILEGLQRGVVPAEYKDEDFEILNSIFESKQMDIPDFDDVVKGLTVQKPVIKIEKAKRIAKEIVKDARRVHENTDRQGKE